MSAAAAVAALSAVDGPVDVVGTGPLADGVRRLLGELGRLADSDVTPTAVIETTGEPTALAAALERGDDLGTVVLAGPTPPVPISLELYADLHVRGLVPIRSAV